MDTHPGGFPVLQRFRETRPTRSQRVIVLFAKLTPSTRKQPEIDQLNGRFTALAASLTTATSPVIVVDQAQGFDAGADTFDGIHRNESGERKMAAQWFEALAANWPNSGGSCD